MKQPVLALVDWFIPPFIQEVPQGEDLERARALVVILGVVWLATLATLIASMVSVEMREFYSTPWAYTFYLWLLIFSLAIAHFRNNGNFNLAGNLFGVGSYLAVVTTAHLLPDEHFLPTLSLILGGPFLVAQIANYRWGMAWLAIVTVTPFAVALFTHPIDQLWLSSWMVTIAGLFFATYIGHYYRENLARRLRNERAHFEVAATHDALTGLANRITFDRRLAACVADSSRGGNSAVMVYIDLNRFKPINDNLGHPTGDQVLVTIGQRLNALVRRTDTVARLGGDEFGILFEHCTLDDMRGQIHRVAEEIRKPVEVDGNRVSVSCSMGVASCPEDGLDPDNLYLIADQRMYEAKANEKSWTGRGNTTANPAIK